MPIPKPQPAAEQENPYLPSGLEPLVCDQFMGINTSTTRAGVDEKQMAWCSGYFPIGPYDLRTLPGVGQIIFAPIASTIQFFGFANIGSNPVAIVFLADGSIFEINTATGVTILMATAGTIVNPSVETTGMTQWGSQYVLIVNNAQKNGYFIWDGSVFYRAGTLAPVVTITNPGSGYVGTVTATASGGSGSGATFTVGLSNTGSVTACTVTFGGSYNSGSASVAFSGGGGSGATAIVNFGQVGFFFTVLGITITNEGSGYSSAPTVTINTFAGNEIAQATATATVGTTGSVVSVTIDNPGSGYVVGDTPTIGFSGGGGTGAAASVTLMPFAIAGTDIETYAQRVWIIDGPLLQFTGPGSLDNFATSIGGGSVTSNDSFLRVGYTRLLQTNGFLYLIGDSSINYISGVQTSGTPPVTTYTNQNADPEVGTPYSATADVFGRNIVFANSFGVHVSYGAAVTKISESLDGVYNTVPNFGGQIPSAGKATIFGKKVWVLLLPVVDPVTSRASNELFLWDGQKKWFSSKQDRSLNFIAFQEINSVLTCWGTDGAFLFPIFQNPSIGFTKTMQTKLWVKPGGYQVNKATTRFWGAVQYYQPNDQAFNITIDTESASQPYTINPPLVIMTWTEDGSTPMVWTTNGSTPMLWSLGPIGIRVFDPQAIGQQGVLNGWTVSTNADDVAIISMSIQAEDVGYRG